MLYPSTNPLLYPYSIILTISLSQEFKVLDNVSHLAILIPFKSVINCSKPSLKLVISVNSNNE